MNKTINPENWIDEEITYSVKNNNLIVMEEVFPITKTTMPDGTTTYSLETLGITAFNFSGIYEATDDAGYCSRSSKDPIEALVKVLSNIY